MQLKHFFIVLFISPLLANSQIYISDGSEEYYAQPTIQESYSVYLKRRSIENGEPTIIDFGLIERKNVS